MSVQSFDPEGMKYSGMSQAVKAGGWIYVSGQVALKDGEVTGIGDSRAQARQAFENIAAVLDEAGASLADVVKLTCFLTEKSAYEGFAEIKNSLFSDNPPASTVVIIDELLLPDLLMEVEAQAWVE